MGCASDLQLISTIVGGTIVCSLLKSAYSYICAELDRLITPSAAPKKAPLLAPLLSPLVSRLHTLHHRMVLLQDREELLLAHLVYSKSSPHNSSSEEGALDGWLHEISTHFSEAVVSLLVDIDETEVKMTSRGLKSKSMESIIKARVTSEIKQIQLVDLRLSGAHQLLSYGVCYELVVPFTWQDEGRRPRNGALWLGFLLDAPSTYDVKAAELFVKKLERDATVLERLSLLNGQIEEAKNQSERKSEFLRHFSHDIRSPLNNIRSVLHVLRHDASSIRDEELIEVGISNCSRLENLVQDILDYSKQQAGILEAVPVEVEVDPLLSDIAAEFKFACKTKGLSLVVHPSSTRVFADQSQLRRIITNLVSNAVKYTSSGTVTLSSMVNGKGVSIVVEDTGKGLSKEEQQKLFIPFSRVDRTGQEGTGLGLVSSLALAKLNGGTIQIESVEGEGSTFTLVLPEAGDDLRAMVATECAKAKEILIFDDDADLLFSLGRALSKEGFKVHVASTIERARDIISANELDLVLSDLQTSDGGYKEFSRMMAAEGKSVPTFVLTGAPGEALALGIGEHLILEKPIDISTLVRRLA